MEFPTLFKSYFVGLPEVPPPVSEAPPKGWDTEMDHLVLDKIGNSLDIESWRSFARRLHENAAAAQAPDFAQPDVLWG